MQSNEKKPMNVAKFFQDFAKRKSVTEYASKLDFKTFHEQHIQMVKLLPYFHFGFSLFSIATAAFYIGDKFYSMLPWLPVAVFFTLAMLGVWEVLKAYAISKLFEKWFYSKEHTGNAKANPALAIVGLAMLSASVFMSVSGAAEAGRKFTDKTEEIKDGTKAKIDSINTVFYNRINADQAAIDEIKKVKRTRKGGWLSGAEVKDLAHLNDSKTRLEEERLSLIDELKSESGQAVTATSQKAENTAYVLVIISSVNEVLICACLWFIWYFSYKTKEEKQALTGTDNLNYLEHLLRILNVNGAFAGLRLPSNERTLNVNAERSPGFVIGSDKDAKTPVNGQYANSTLNVNVERSGYETVIGEGDKIKTCEHPDCSQLFRYKHWNAQYCSNECRRNAHYLRNKNKNDT